MGQMTKTFGAGLLIGVLVSACAAVAFPYKYYQLLIVSYDGTLRGPTATDDLNFKVCAPTAADRNPCAVMLTKDFMALKLDYLQTKTDLIACQKGH